MMQNNNDKLTPNETIYLKKIRKELENENVIFIIIFIFMFIFLSIFSPIFINRDPFRLIIIILGCVSLYGAVYFFLIIKLKQYSDKITNINGTFNVAIRRTFTSFQFNIIKLLSIYTIDSVFVAIPEHWKFYEYLKIGEKFSVKGIKIKFTGLDQKKIEPAEQFIVLSMGRYSIDKEIEHGVHKITNSKYPLILLILFSALLFFLVIIGISIAFEKNEFQENKFWYVPSLVILIIAAIGSFSKLLYNNYRNNTISERIDEMYQNEMTINNSKQC